MAIAPYKATPDEDPDNPYASAGPDISDATNADPNKPVKPVSDAGGPQPYTPPPTALTPGKPSDTHPDLPPVRTFAQMEAEGQARPPAPTTSPVQPQTGGPLLAGPPVPEVPTDAGGQGGLEVNSGPEVNSIDAGSMGGPPLPTTSDDAHGQAVSGATGLGDVPTSPGRPMGDVPTSPGTAGSPSDSILSLLTGGAQGTATDPIGTATRQATLDQLNSPNPFNSDEVKREYNDLGSGIDADFDQRQRDTSNQFAQRGLYGSVGKDFASGRAADTDVGRRTAKTQLASDLAKAQAVSQGQYQSNAISQGQAGTQQAQGNQLAWLQSLMGYGNDAFSHDLQTAQFQEGQNESEQDYLLKLLQAGYGV